MNLAWIPAIEDGKTVGFTREDGTEILEENWGTCKTSHPRDDKGLIVSRIDKNKHRWVYAIYLGSNSETPGAVAYARTIGAAKKIVTEEDRKKG